MKGPGCNSDPGEAAVANHLKEYEAKKRKYLNTHDKCATEGIEFCPLIFEAHAGGWSPAVSKFLQTAAKRADARRQPSNVWGQSTIAIYSQRLAVALQCTAAKAMLRRELNGTDRFQ